MTNNATETTSHCDCDCHFYSKAIQKTISKEVITLKQQLKETLSVVGDVAMTMDIWSDRQMRGYMGITIHFISSQCDCELRSNVLSVDRFTGKYT